MTLERDGMVITKKRHVAIFENETTTFLVHVFGIV